MAEPVPQPVQPRTDTLLDRDHPEIARVEALIADVAISAMIALPELELLPLPIASRTCTTCETELPVSAFADLPASCKHKNETCPDCWEGWLESEVKSKRPDQVGCAQCKTVLAQDVVWMLASEPIYEMYVEAALKLSLGDDPDFRWCHAPGCTAGQLHTTDTAGNICTCYACGHRVCVLCDVVWHEGQTCEQFKTAGIKNAAAEAKMAPQNNKDRYYARIAKHCPAPSCVWHNGQTCNQFKAALTKDNKQAVLQRQKEERRSAKTLLKTSKLCPGAGCGRKIAKNDGCDHMTCTICSHEFCWACLAPYGPIRRFGNSAHEPDCPHWA